jgi:hypothetical protein
MKFMIERDEIYRTRYFVEADSLEDIHKLLDEDDDFELCLHYESTEFLYPDEDVELYIEQVPG